MWTSTASAPALARSTNSAAITSTSMSTTCLSPAEYAAWSARKLAMNATDQGPRYATRPNARHARTTASAIASRVGSSPLAIGRSRFTGCSRSWGASRTSFARYAALEAAQYATKATQASSHRPVSPILPANSRPANRRRFFVHWRGRNATSAARPTERGTATAVTAIGRMVDGHRRPAAAQSVARRWAPPGGAASKLRREASPAGAGRTGCPYRARSRARCDRRARPPARGRSPDPALCRRRPATRTAGRCGRGRTA